MKTHFWEEFSNNTSEPLLHRTLSWEIERCANNGREEKNYWEKVVFNSAQGTEVLLPFKKSKTKNILVLTHGILKKILILLFRCICFPSAECLQTLWDSISQNSGLPFPSWLHGSAEKRQAHTGAEGKESPRVGLWYCCATELPLFAVPLIGPLLRLVFFLGNEATTLICDISGTFMTNKSLDCTL